MKKMILVILLISPALAFSQRLRSFELIGGPAINDGDAGYNVSAAFGPQWNHFGFSTYTGFLGNPSKKFTNWTIIGLQLKALGNGDKLKPYVVFDFGLFNFQTIGDNVNMRTASLDLGGGIEKKMKNGNGLLFDFRWKSLVDYAGSREAVRFYTFNVGIRL